MRRAECSHEARQHQADNHWAGQGFIEALLANIQFEFEQAQTGSDWPKGMNKICQMFLVTSAMLTFLDHKTHIYVPPNSGLI